MFELFSEQVGDASPIERIERYARLAFEYGPFVRALGGDEFPPQLFIVSDAINENTNDSTH